MLEHLRKSGCAGKDLGSQVLHILDAYEAATMICSKTNQVERGLLHMQKVRQFLQDRKAAGEVHQSYSEHAAHYEKCFDKIETDLKALALQKKTQAWIHTGKQIASGLLAASAIAIVTYGVFYARRRA